MAVCGLVVLAVTAMGASYADNYTIFMVFMAGMGVGAALIPAAMFPYVAKTSPQGKAGLYVGTIVASGTLGVIIGRVSMGLMTEIMGWQLSFRSVGALYLCFAMLTFLFLVEKNPKKESNERTILELYGNSMRLMFRPEIFSLLLVGFSLFVGFLGMVTFLTYRLLEPPFNFTSGQIGWISFAGITAIVAPFSGSISQRVGILNVLIPGLVCCLLSFQLMGWFASIPLITIGLLLLFLSVYSSQPLIFLFIGQNVPRDSIGSASSLYILFCIGGGSLSSIFLGPVWEAYGWIGITTVCSFFSCAILDDHVVCRLEKETLESLTTRGSSPE